MFKYSQYCPLQKPYRSNKIPKRQYPNPVLQNILPVWKIQSKFSKIIRWKEWLVRLGKKLVRRQTCTEHVLSIEFVARYIVDLYTTLSPESVDRVLILDTVHFHDYGEPLRKRDILATKKKDTDDRDEYLAFIAFISNLPKPLFTQYQRAFLLQFCLENAECFPEEAREIMANLKKNKYREAVFFQFIEHWDYLLYAVEQYQERKNTEILAEVIERSRRMTNDFKETIPELFEVFLDPATLAWEEEFLKQHS